MYNNIDAMIVERLRREARIIRKRKSLKNLFLIFTKKPKEISDDYRTLFELNTVPLFLK